MEFSNVTEPVRPVPAASRKSSENQELLRGAGVVGIFTAASRVMGFVRDAVLAHYFGAAWLMDIFVVAFRIPNTFRRLFAEGSLTIAFVPVFTDTLRKEGEEEAKRLFSSIFTFAALLLTVFTVLGLLGSRALVWAFAEGFMSDPAKFELAVRATRIVFPYIMLISLVAACMGALNALRHFSAPAASTLLLNLAIIVGASVVPNLTTWDRLTCACLGVLVGGILQLLLQIPFLRAKGFLPRFRFDLKSPRVRRVLRLTLPALLGSGVYQLSIILITRFASQIPGGGANSYLYYADRVVELPLGIFAIAVSTSALPSLSRLVADGNREAFRDTMAFALRSVLFIVLPAAAGLIALRVGITQILFQSGEFTWKHTIETSRALFYFACGLPLLASVRVIVAAFNAHQDTKTPVKMAVFALSCTVVLSYLLMGPMGHRGLALAVAISNAINCIGLILCFRALYGRIAGREIGSALLRLGSLSAIMGMGVSWGAQWTEWSMGGRTLEKTFMLFLLIGLGGAVYLTASKVLGFPEFQEFFSRFQGRMRWNKS